MTKKEQIVNYANQIATVAFYLNGRRHDNYSHNYDNGYHPMNFKVYNKVGECKEISFRRFHYNNYSFQALFPNAKNKPGYGPVHDICINLEKGKWSNDESEYMAKSLLGKTTDEIEFMQVVLLAVKNELREMLQDIKKNITL